MEYPSNLCHITFRGIKKKYICKEDQDHDNFLRIDLKGVRSMVRTERAEALARRRGEMVKQTG